MMPRRPMPCFDVPKTDGIAGPQGERNLQGRVDAVLEMRLAGELRARHAAQSMEMHELKTIVAGLKERLDP